jgi:hypothetical protein
MQKHATRKQAAEGATQLTEIHDTRIRDMCRNKSETQNATVAAGNNSITEIKLQQQE